MQSSNKSVRFKRIKESRMPGGIIKRCSTRKDHRESNRAILNRRIDKEMKADQ